jgi:predicted  nucleic acid-binding Zn-ribbon protein
MSSIDKRIAQLRDEMRPLQELYGLKSKTIEQRYQEIQAREQLKQQGPRPKFKLPKL